MQIHEITKVSVSEGIEDLDLRRKPGEPRAPITTPPSEFAADYAKALKANPAQAEFAKRMAQLQQKQPTGQAQPSAPQPQITQGSGPNAQIWVWDGKNYLDKKTGATMPPALQQLILKSQGVK